MSLSVSWSLNAKEDLATILAYLEQNFGIDSALDVLDTIDVTISLIADFPEMYPRSIIQPSVRKAVITKQTSLIYRIQDQEIQILHVWDNRRATEF